MDKCPHCGADINCAQILAQRSRPVTEAMKEQRKAASKKAAEKRKQKAPK